MIVGMPLFIMMVFFNMCQYFLRAERKAAWYSGFAVFKSAGGLGIALLLIFLFNKGIESLLWGMVAAIAVMIPLLWNKAFDARCRPRIRMEYKMTSSVARYGFPLIFVNLANWALSLSDRYIIEAFRGAGEVGIYSASYKISNSSIMLLVTLFMLASSPISIRIWERDGEERSREFLAKLTRYYLLVCVPAGVALCILAEPVVGLLTGREYFEGYRIIPLVTAGVLIFGIQHRFQVGFKYRKKTGFITLGVVSACVLNIVLNLIFVPKHGYFAAAVTTLISYIFLLFLMVALSRKIFVWRFPIESFVRILAASTVMALSMYFVSISLKYSVIINLLITLSVGTAVYLFTLLVTKELRENEMKMIRGLFKKKG
jgi:O-antigen/teichoic acid export membrane protein